MFRDGESHAFEVFVKIPSMYGDTLNFQMEHLTQPTLKRAVTGFTQIDEFMNDKNNEAGTMGQVLCTAGAGID
ncbi:hypothetical protein FORMB_20060 [Formosa sp. Hel1_33_131]|jgi:hypothetical protein|uniref:hypothetical protein n=1 Tax=Formosa sp. Hel1_33_131 TaxID=1336794 RepID=UPI00084E24C2|nr:hypothetical protein [Formosa sp. Hel1_33_131]AOR29035.1 hypothetical protein FORMB_20060 [Formosa sp. Hel1_33_131]